MILHQYFNVLAEFRVAESVFEYNREDCLFRRVVHALWMVLDICQEALHHRITPGRSPVDINQQLLEKINNSSEVVVIPIQ